MVYNEKDNGSTSTNYAGYDTLNLTVVPDQEEPEVDNVYTNSNNTYYKPDVSDNAVVVSITAGTNTKDISSLGRGGVTNVEVTGGATSITVYDAAGNPCQVTPAQATPDITPPGVDVVYDQGTYTITATDAGAGIWKIVDPLGTPLPATSDSAEADYSASFPSEASYTANGPITISSVTVYDGVNNYTTKLLDTEAPSVPNNKGYKKGTTAIIKATDEDSGLWKVVLEPSKTAAPVGDVTFPGVNATEILTFTIPESTTSTVYVVDKAGNVSGAITLDEDTNAPTATAS